MADEARDEQARRAVVERVRAVDLLDASLVQYDDAVGHRQRFLLIVRDDDGGDAKGLQQALDLDLHVEAQILVERRERFVEQDEARIDRKRPRQRDALLLSAGELSGGQQQRVALARALAIDPGLVLLDEPFSALDKNLRLDMQIEIKSLLKTFGVTSIIVTHDQEEALSMADRIVVLNKGRIEQIDSPDALYDRPASLFISSFIGHTNLLRGTVTDADRVQLDAGPEIDLGRSAQRRRGTPVTISVRPENITFDAERPGAIPVTIRATVPLGAVSVTEGVTASGEAVKVSQARAAGLSKAQAGDTAWLAISDVSRVSIFSTAIDDVSKHQQRSV